MSAKILLHEFNFRVTKVLTSAPVVSCSFTIFFALLKLWKDDTNHWAPVAVFIKLKKRLYTFKTNSVLNIYKCLCNYSSDFKYH